MFKMFYCLTGILEKDEKKRFLKLFILTLITPVFDLFSFSAVILILNAAVESGRPSSHQLLEVYKRQDPKEWMAFRIRTGNPFRGYLFSVLPLQGRPPGIHPAGTSLLLL